MNVTATEFKNQLGYFLDVVSKEDVCISKNGKLIAKLCSPNKNRVDSAKQLSGSTSFNADTQKDLSLCSNNNLEVLDNKLEAFARLEASRRAAKESIDYNSEREEAMNEKYGIIA